jgi:tripartite-type tricarboxylate transporter receptor subunit TctC
MRHARLRSALGILIWLCASTSIAQPYPTKPVKFIMPVIAGTSNELIFRLITPQLTESLGQPVLLESNPAASGIPGTNAVARAAPDGYTILWGTTSQMISVVFLNKNVPYDPIKDFTPIGPIVDTRLVLLASASSPVKSFADMVQQSKRNPGKLTYGSSGVGAYFHPLGEAIKLAGGGLDIVHVPYKGTVAAMQDAASGQITLTFGTVASSRGLREAGRLIPSAITGATRYSGLPQVPTVSEGAPRFAKPPSWFSFWGPAGLPSSIVQRLNTDLQKTWASKQFTTWVEENGAEVLGHTPEDVSRLHKDGFETFRTIVKALGLEPQ